MAFTALVDANALYSAAVRDTLLRAAELDLFRPKWTRQILSEMAGAIKKNHPGIDHNRIDRMVQKIIEEFPEALVDNYQALIPVMQNHEGDRHVLAAAVMAGAGVIVTWNSAHFPLVACAPYDIDVQSPDEFLLHLWHLDSECVANILDRQAASLVRPARSTRQLIDTLSRSVPRFAQTALESGLLEL